MKHPNRAYVPPPTRRLSPQRPTPSGGPQAHRYKPASRAHSLPSVGDVLLLLTASTGWIVALFALAHTLECT